MTILASQKYGIEYLEHCAIRAADDRLTYVRAANAVEQHFSIPNLNTAVLLLGPGTSLTQQAARLCAEGGIVVGFCGGGGTPVYLGSLNEYREPKYSRAWIRMYESERQRLEVAKRFQRCRANLVIRSWVRTSGMAVNPEMAGQTFLKNIDSAETTEQLLGYEAVFTKELYRLLSVYFGKEFTRKPQTKAFANEALDSGNYLAYGLAACCLWVLGIPYSYPVMHGKTRRGALVFDVADIIKDAYVMPTAFISAAAGESASVCRRRILAAFDENNALKLLFEQVQQACEI
ncbi:type I-F CRISPR-associated endonuclease Cas1f [Nostoc sp. CHAB 5834]|nr:type I-F CRISPR-associated endonuclease Cas1f [Nostoc sp. CHAB 5834]